MSEDKALTEEATAPSIGMKVARGLGFVLLKVALPVAVVFATVLYFGHLKETRPQAPKRERPPNIPMVETTPADTQSRQAIVKAVGRVVPAQQMVLQSEVSGRVVYHAPELVAGGVLRAGTTAVRLDSTDYDLAVKQQVAQVSKAKFEIQVERGRQTVAKQEWSLLDGTIKSTSSGKSLALREPHIRLAKANLSSARSTLARAKLMAGKTNVSVPFNAFVKSEMVEVGMLATPASQLATLIGTDAFWVEASVPVAQLRWINVPGVNGFQGAYGTSVKITQEVGAGPPLVREGRVLRLLGELDGLGVQARLLVEVKDPLALNTPGIPLMLGAFVNLEMAGQPLDGAVAVPREALRSGDKVWVLTKDKKLDVRDVKVRWRDEDVVFLDAGVEVGEQLIRSKLQSPVVGMQLRLPGDGPPTSGPAGADQPKGDAPATPTKDAPKPVPAAPSAVMRPGTATPAPSAGSPGASR